jgi:hypothetical protein
MEPAPFYRISARAIPNSWWKRRAMYGYPRSCKQFFERDKGLEINSTDLVINEIRTYHDSKYVRTGISSVS